MGSEEAKKKQLKARVQGCRAARDEMGLQAVSESRDAEGYMGISLGYIVMAEKRKHFWLGCLGRWRGMR